MVAEQPNEELAAKRVAGKGGHVQALEHNGTGREPRGCGWGALSDKLCAKVQRELLFKGSR